MNRVIVFALVIVAIVVVALAVSISLSFSNPPRVSAQSSTTQTISDPWLMSCDDLHSTILNLQQQAMAVATGYPSGVNYGADYGGPLSGLLNYYTQVYNERISLKYIPGVGSGGFASGVCDYP